jgi:hypothetical protein
MLQIFYWIAAVSFVLTLLIRPFVLYIWVPIGTHRKNVHQLARKHEVANLQTMSPEAGSQLERVMAQFREEGFEPIGPPLASISNQFISAVHTVFVNQKGDVAENFSTAAKTQSFIRSQTFVIRSRFSNGSEVATQSTRSTGVFPSDPLRDTVYFSWVKDAHTLCEAHRRRMHMLGFDDRPRVAQPGHGEHEAYLREQEKKEMDRVARAGYYYFDEKGQVYRQTWRGAFFMAWKLLTPWKQLLLRKHERRGQQVWRELGMDQWRLGVPAASAAEESPSFARSGGVEYEPQLVEGEILTRRDDNSLTVRIGMESRRRYLAQQWISYLVIIVMAFAIGVNHYLRWLYGGRLRMTPRGSFMYGLWWVVICWILVGLIIGLLRRRGTVTLFASQRGLQYRNILALRGQGEIAREDIGFLQVVLYKLGLRRRTYQLLLQREIGDNLILATGKDKKELERVRDLLAEAMGVKEKEQPATAIA